MTGRGFKNPRYEQMASGNSTDHELYFGVAVIAIIWGGIYLLASQEHQSAYRDALRHRQAISPACWKNTLAA